MELSNNQNLLIQYSFKIIIILIILVIGIVLSCLISKTINKFIKLQDIDITISNFLASIAKYCILTFTLIICLSYIGVQTTSIITIIGAASLAIALSLQNSLSNLAAGVLLIILRPFRIGEYVNLKGVLGTVNQIQIFTTTLLTSDNKTIIIPNSKIINENIINYSRQTYRKINILVKVNYKSKINLVKKILLETVCSDKRIIQEKGINVRLKNITTSFSLNFVVSFWIKNIDYSDAYYSFIEKIKIAIEKNNLNISYKQININILSDQTK